MFSIYNKKDKCHHAKYSPHNNEFPHCSQASILLTNLFTFLSSEPPLTAITPITTLLDNTLRANPSPNLSTLSHPPFSTIHQLNICKINVSNVQIRTQDTIISSHTLPNFQNTSYLTMSHTLHTILAHDTHRPSPLESSQPPNKTNADDTPDKRILLEWKILHLFVSMNNKPTIT